MDSNFIDKFFNLSVWLGRGDKLQHIQLKAKFPVLMVAYGVLNNTAIMQPYFPPTFPVDISSSVMINPKRELVLYAGTMILHILYGKFLYPGCKSIQTIFRLTCPLQSWCCCVKQWKYFGRRLVRCRLVGMSVSAIFFFFFFCPGKSCLNNDLIVIDLYIVG